ncbi:MAG: ABC transporter ATP-binding protein [Candidatus Gracilibacteria bacterium]|nr:ABC transporter ATP-binding protein [Candidatus Gracilibacteria bacterium]
MINLKNIKKSYNLGKNNSIDILKNINLEIKPGEFVAIVGPSGSGKSTLMNIIGMLDTPSSGEYYFSSERVDKLKDSKLSQIRSRKIGFIFQNYSLLPRMSALEQVILPLTYQGLSGKDSKNKAIEYLEKVGLGDKLKNKPNELSGGQSQRVAIARALVIDPDLILADEPTGALDSKTGEEILNILKEINKAGKTIIIITHDNNIASHANRIIKIKDGEIVD